MGHERNKPRREKRRPKKEKVVLAKPARDADVIEHVSQHTEATRGRS